MTDKSICPEGSNCPGPDCWLRFYMWGDGCPNAKANWQRIEPTQQEIDGVAAVFDEIADDPIAQGSAYIMAKKLKRVFARE